MRLVSHHLCPYVQRAVIVLTEKNVPHERTYINLSEKPDWFLAASPLGRAPILQTNGSTLFESQVIIEYIDEIFPNTLHPSEPLERARHRSWIEFASSTLDAIGKFYNASDKDNFDRAMDNLRAKFESIDREIKGPLFAGDKFHIIDAAWAPVFRYFDVIERIYNFELFDGLENIIGWRKHLLARPSVKNGVPEGYEDRLKVFLMSRNSYVSGLLRKLAKNPLSVDVSAEISDIRVN